MSEKVDKRYWESVWQPTALPQRVIPEQDTLRNHSYHHMHRYFEEFVRPAAALGARLIEFGCAQSIWLSYFARRFGFGVPAETGSICQSYVCTAFFDLPARFAEAVFGCLGHVEGGGSLASPLRVGKRQAG